jgi:sarcosine oxidase subunit beta
MDDELRSSHIAIVGAGITGLSVAYHLGLAGFLDVCVYERLSMGSGASGIAPGGVRRQWSTAVACALSDDAFQFYRTINEELEPDTDPVFRACGYLFLAHSEEARRALESDVALQHRFGIPSQIVEGEEIVRIVPALRVDGVLAASYCAEDGYFDDPWAVLAAFARAARRLGVRIEQAEVVGLHADGAGWQLTLSDGQSVRAEGVVIAAGANSTTLLRPLGVDLPIGAEPRYLFYSYPVEERICDPLVVSAERRFAVKQLADGQVLASYLAAGRDGAPMAPEAWKAHIAETAMDLLPALLDVQLTHLVKGSYDMTPDHQPIVGAPPGLDGIWIAAGLSGHGFMMAPAIGKVVAGLIAGADVAWYVRELRPGRFDSRRLLAESRVI